MQWEWWSVVPKLLIYQSNYVVKTQILFWIGGISGIRLLVEKSTASQSISY